jgi:hypothetical protein
MLKKLSDDQKWELLEQYKGSTLELIVCTVLLSDSALYDLLTCCNISHASLLVGWLVG